MIQERIFWERTYEKGSSQECMKSNVWKRLNNVGSYEEKDEEKEEEKPKLKNNVWESLDVKHDMW